MTKAVEAPIPAERRPTGRVVMRSDFDQGRPGPR
jgi:hypothetical protein